MTSFAGVPSWMLSLLQKVIEKTGRNNVIDIWNDCEVYFHGGVSFEPYKILYKELFPSKDFKYFEIYNASEGFFGIQDQVNSKDLLLMLDYGIFYEFIPFDQIQEEEPKALDISQVKINQVYALLITTNAGLWRYNIGDTIIFTSINPHRILSLIHI